MIRVDVVKKDEHYHSMTVTGHAETGEPGYDLVCAGVSSIMVGALNAFDHFDPSVALTLNEEPCIKIKITKKSEITEKMFEFVLIQLKTVEVSHPQAIEILEKEVKS